ncbi:unnamed protein product [Moneuplotes crassus]|uniref:Ubiquitin-like domain-containing protein n=1 Tax=Euplotes crassus TaxID=5936 RepID=A0AAD2D140_EUPCR|nr:unnamed protein product [Moneuplotes crassus]
MSHRFILYIKELTGKTHEVQMTYETSVEDVKFIMQDLEGYAPEDQRIIFAGKQLEEHRLLVDYSVSKNSTLHLVLRT